MSGKSNWQVLVQKDRDSDIVSVYIRNDIATCSFNLIERNFNDEMVLRELVKCAYAKMCEFESVHS